MVRTLQFERVPLRRDIAAEAWFTLNLAAGIDPARCEIVAFLQDEQTGAIVQVASTCWNERSQPNREPFLTRQSSIRLVDRERAARVREFGGE